MAPHRPAPTLRAHTLGLARAPQTHPSQSRPEALAASPPSTVPGALLTPAQAADALGVTSRVLERWRGCGGGPVFVRLSRKSIRYSAEDIQAFVAAGRRASTAPGAGLLTEG